MVVFVLRGPKLPLNDRGAHVSFHGGTHVRCCDAAVPQQNTVQILTVAEGNDLAMAKCSLSVLTVLQVCLRALILVLHCYKLHLYLWRTIWAQMTMVSHSVPPVVTPCTDDPLLKLSGSLRTIWEVQLGSWYARSTHSPGTLFLMVALGIRFYVWFNLAVVPCYRTNDFHGEKWR